MTKQIIALLISYQTYLIFDDNTRYKMGKLRFAADRIFDLFCRNAMKANQSKCHLFSSLDLNTSLSLQNYVIKNIKPWKVLEITIDNKLTFNEQGMKNLCGKVSREINTLYTPEVKSNRIIDAINSLMTEKKLM